MSSEKKENNLISKIVNEPETVLIMAVNIFAEAQKNTLLDGGQPDYLLIAEEIKKIVKGRDFFSTLDILNNFSEYHKIISDWAPEVTEFNIGAASPFQGALLDLLEETMIKQVNEKENIFIEKCTLYGDKKLNSTLQNAFANINDDNLNYMVKREAFRNVKLITDTLDLKEQNFLNTKDSYIEKIKLYGDWQLENSFKNSIAMLSSDKIDFSDKRKAFGEVSLIMKQVDLVEKIFFKIKELEKDLGTYLPKITIKHTTHKIKQIKWYDKALRLGIQTIKPEMALEELRALKKILLDSKIPSNIKISKFEEKFNQNQKIISDGMPEKIKSGWKEFVGWIKQFFKPQKSSKTEKYKESLLQIKDTLQQNRQEINDKPSPNNK